MDPQRGRSRHRLNARGIVFVAGVVLLLVAAPALFVAAVNADANWAVLAGLGCALCGLIAVGQILMPQRSSFRAGTKIWQNDGLPGGGGGAGG